MIVQSLFKRYLADKKMEYQYEMDEKKALDLVLKKIKKAGIEIVTDKEAFESAFGESFESFARKEYIQKLVTTYAEGERPPDLSPSEITIRNSKGKDETMYTVKFYGERPKDYVPKMVGKAYKLMEQWPDGSLHALFAAAKKNSYELGTWQWAEGFSRDESTGQMAQNLAPRYGWHMGTGVPSAPHLMGIGSMDNPKPGYYSKSEAGHPKGSKRVWVEVSYDATHDYTDVAEKNPKKSEKDIRGLVPFGGYYMFQESNLSNWIVASSIKLERIIPEEERQQIMKNAGYNEELEWRKRVLRPKLKAAHTSLLKHVDYASPKSIDRLAEIAYKGIMYI